MRILLCHNYYQQRGGEDQCFEDEGALLESHGHEVWRYTRHNDDVAGMGSLDLARQTLWSSRTYREVRELIRRHRPQIMHCTNTFPLISPAAYRAARDEGVPVVQALHNYRAVCPKAQFLRNDRTCEACLNRRIPWPAVVYKCYRGSRRATAVVATLVAWQRISRSAETLVTRFYTLSQFARQKLIEGGLPADRIDVKPNFLLEDPGPGSGGGGYAVFVGRLSPVKGIGTLLDAWIARPGLPRLQVVGDGPLAEEVRQAGRRDPRIEWVGHKRLEDVCRIVGRAACLVMPSVWYETFGRTVMEAYAVGTPAIVSRLGAMNELVDDGRTGWRFTAGDSTALAAKVLDLLSDPRRLAGMRKAARAEFETRYTAASNYRMLCSIYHRAGVREPAAQSVAPAAAPTQ
ncbi:MAG: glycosyltransferase family 4 protein [Thermoguttaceae bacterium]